MNHPAPFRTCLATLLALAVLGVTVACVFPEHDHRRYGGRQGERAYPQGHEHQHEHEFAPQHRP